MQAAVHLHVSAERIPASLVWKGTGSAGVGLCTTSADLTNMLSVEGHG
jgi:hypothetical protein